MFEILSYQVQYCFAVILIMYQIKMTKNFIHWIQLRGTKFFQTNHVLSKHLNSKSSEQFYFRLSSEFELNLRSLSGDREGEGREMIEMETIETEMIETETCTIYRLSYTSNPLVINVANQ